MSQLRTQVEEIATRLRALVAADKLAVSADQVMTDLAALEDIPMTKDLMAQTKIIQPIGIIKKKGTSESREKAEAVFAQLMAIARGEKAAPVRSTSKEDMETKRKKNRSVLCNVLTKAQETMDDAPKVSANDLSVVIEKEVWAKPDREERFKRLVSCLTDSVRMASLRFGQRLLSGDLSPVRFASFEADDLMTEEQMKKKESARERMMFSRTVPGVMAIESSTHKCRKCGSNKIQSYELQTRSADEPMTNFCKCAQCGNEWRS